MLVVDSQRSNDNDNAPPECQKLRRTTTITVQLAAAVSLSFFSFLSFIPVQLIRISCAAQQRRIDEETISI